MSSQKEFFLKRIRCLGQKCPKTMIEYGKINSKILSDAKYILLFHISSYVRYVFLNRCQLKEIDSTYIILEGKSNFVKKRFCQICEKS